MHGECDFCRSTEHQWYNQHVAENKVFEKKPELTEKIKIKKGFAHTKLFASALQDNQNCINHDFEVKN